MVKTFDYEFKLGIAAISWVNDDIPGLGDHYSIDHILRDMSSIGYTATEMGRTFPQDISYLEYLLEKYNIQLASKFIGVLFSDPKLQDDELKKFTEWADFLKKIGCQYVITCEMGGSMHWDRRRPNANKIVPLSDQEWNHMVQGLHRAAEICKERGMELVYHPHAGTVVEQREEVDRLMDSTNPELVHLLYDTGHAYYGHYDPLEQLKKYYHRIRYVHYKDVRHHVLQKAREENWTFRKAVLKGVFTVPGNGCIDFKPILEELMSRGYKGWTIVEAEQDPDIAPPYHYAKMAKDYLDGLISEIRDSLTL